MVAAFPKLEEIMSERLRIQALGAALSRRDWNATERAYEAIRDEYDTRAHAQTVPESVVLPEGIVLGEFKPCYMVNEAMNMVEVLFEDVSSTSKPLIDGVYHWIDKLVAHDDGRVVGLNFWIYKPPAQCAPQPSGEMETCVVPLNPTEDMLKAARNAWFLPNVGPYYTGYSHIYRAMLGAAPAVVTLKIDVAQAPPDDDPHGDGHCGCSERCKDRDNCQYDTPQPSFSAVSSAAREAFILNELRALAIKQHVRPAYEGRFVNNGRSCAICKGEWADDAPEFHAETCPLSEAFVVPAAGGEASKREADLREALRNIRAAIMEADPAVLCCTLWMPNRISPAETVVDHIDAALAVVPDERVSTTGGGE
jgi:hypothetical protein